MFELRRDGPTLIEIAPGVDLRRDILDQMEFAPLVAEFLKVTDSSFYTPRALAG